MVYAYASRLLFDNYEMSPKVSSLTYKSHAKWKMLLGIYSAIYGEVNVSVSICGEIKGDYIEEQQSCFVSVTLNSWSGRKLLDQPSYFLSCPNLNLTGLVKSKFKYSPQHPILKHPQPKFLPQCQRPSFTPIQNNWQNIVLYILIFKFLDNQLEDKRFCTE